MPSWNDWDQINKVTVIIDSLKIDKLPTFHMSLDAAVADPSTLPQQLSFEMHTEGANHKCVPNTAVTGRRAAQLQQLFQRLWKVGHGVVHKEINAGDPQCAEFVLHRFFLGSPFSQQNR